MLFRSVGKIIKLDYANFSGSNANGGGEFGAFIKKSDGSFDTGKGSENFRTFCAEVGEHFSSSNQLYISALNVVTVATGKVMSNEAAWLFREFSLLKATGYVGKIGGVSGTDYASTDGDADLLQRALWYFTNGQTYKIDDHLTNKYVIEANKASHDTIIANLTVVATPGLKSIGGVSIMNLNLNTASGTNMQDQFYYNPEAAGSFSSVPEPLSVTMWLTTLLVGACVYRRRQNRV